MITITKSTARRHFFDLELSSSEAIRLPATVVLEYGALPGHHFTDEQWATIVEAGQLAECERRLHGLLARRPHTEAEVSKKLRQRGFSPSQIEPVVTSAKSAGLIDDALFARLYIEEKERAGLGRMRIHAELRRRGVNRACIAAAQESVNNDLTESVETREYRKALAAGRQKWARMPAARDTTQRKAALLRFLASRGFSAADGWRVVAAVTNGDESDMCD